MIAGAKDVASSLGQLSITERTALLVKQLTDSLPDNSEELFLGKSNNSSETDSRHNKDIQPQIDIINVTSTSDHLKGKPVASKPDTKRHKDLKSKQKQGKDVKKKKSEVKKGLSMVPAMVQHAMACWVPVNQFRSI